MASIRVYADTSVYGGVFDAEFAEHSKAFFDQTRLGRFRLVSSALIADEIEPAPLDVRRLFDEFAPLSEQADLDERSLALRDAYVEAGIVGKRWLTDAAHVAIATVAGCAAIVSWNFHHIVHLNKIDRYNAVNILGGYGRIAIHSPSEVITYGQDF